MKTNNGYDTFQVKLSMTKDHRHIIYNNDDIDMAVFLTHVASIDRIAKVTHSWLHQPLQWICRMMRMYDKRKKCTDDQYTNIVNHLLLTLTKYGLFRRDKEKELALTDKGSQFIKMLRAAFISSVNAERSAENTLIAAVIASLLAALNILFGSANFGTYALMLIDIVLYWIAFDEWCTSKHNRAVSYGVAHQALNGKLTINKIHHSANQTNQKSKRSAQKVG